MATPVNWFGKAFVQVSFFTANQSTFANPVDLGYTENGIECEEIELTMPVYSDENGGQQGLPFDYQVMGEQIFIPLALTRFDQAVVAKMKRPWSVPLTNGMMQTPGSLIYQDRGFFRLAYGNNNRGVVFPKCTLALRPKTYNRGTRHELTTLGVMAQGARIDTTVDQVTTTTWMTFDETGTSLANAWTKLPATYS